MPFTLSKAEKYRARQAEASVSIRYSGIFIVPTARGRLCVVASVADPEMSAEAQWEHVSVHCRTGNPRNPRLCTPTWTEMCQVKSLFWDAEDTVMQLHPPESEYVNVHQHVLHLWRPAAAAILRPPVCLV